MPRSRYWRRMAIVGLIKARRRCFCGELCLGIYEPTSGLRRELIMATFIYFSDIEPPHSHLPSCLTLLQATRRPREKGPTVRVLCPPLLIMLTVSTLLFMTILARYFALHM